jgi:hypothetical protein
MHLFLTDRAYTLYTNQPIVWSTNANYSNGSQPTNTKERGIIVRNTGTMNTAKDWVRLAAKLGVLFTEPKARSAIADRLNDRVDDVADTVTSKYEDAVDRLESAAAAFQGRSSWPSRVAGFCWALELERDSEYCWRPRPAARPAKLSVTKPLM